MSVRRWGVRVALLCVLLLLVIIIFGAGQRSGVQKDIAYVVSKELKAAAEHFWYRLRSGGAETVEPFKAGRSQSFYANDFTLTLGRIEELGRTEQSAGFVQGADGQWTKYEMFELPAHWEKLKIGDIVTDAQPVMRRSGGLRQVLTHHGHELIYVSLGKDGCPFLSLIDMTDRREVFRTPCIPLSGGSELQSTYNFTTTGGGYVSLDDGLLFAVGTPSDEPLVEAMAQDMTSPFGKVLYFSDKRLFDKSADKSTFEVHTAGHRNPQGMVKVGNSIYAVEHGAKGGDEINLIEKGGNYGWPIHSVGSTYAGNAFHPKGDRQQFRAPLYAFVPSVAPSDVTMCPASLAKRYEPLDCLLVSTLRGQSVLVVLIDTDDHRVMSVERIDVGMRLREFVWLGKDVLGVSGETHGVFHLSAEHVATVD